MDNDRHPPASGLNAPPGGGRDLGSGAALAESLGRLVVFAGVYPAEHVRVTSLAGPLAEAIAGRATDEAPCSFVLVQDGLLVDDEELPATSVATRRLRRDLDLLGDLGMSAMDMGVLLDDVDLYPDEMLSDVARRLGFGQKFDEAVGLASA